MATRIVLASDDTIIREGLRSLFHQAPEVEIIGAQTIMATPKKVRELVPDVVLIEVSVPGRAHGLRAAINIAEQSPEARVVILTNNSDLPYVRSMLAAGVSGYLLKNSETSQLFAAVRSVKLGGRFIDPDLSSDLVWYAIERKTKKARLSFSRRESEVFSRLVRGYTNAEAAHLLKLSVKTVETYRLRIYRKLHLRTRAELVEYALAHRLLTENQPIAELAEH
jgi:two-component system, NarL family, response regulator NreC